MLVVGVARAAVWVVWLLVGLGLGVLFGVVGWRFCWWAIELLVNWRNCDRIDVSVIVCRLELGAVRRLVMSGAIDLLTPRRRTALVSSEVLMNPALSGSSNAAATLVFFSFTSWPKSSSDESPWEQLRKANSVLILRTVPASQYKYIV